LRRKAVLKCADRVKYVPKFRGGAWWHTKISGKPSKMKSKRFKPVIIGQYTEVEFSSKCNVWIKDLKSCRSEKEWKEIKGLYDSFVTAYAKTHPKIKYPKCPSWKWVHDHEHHHTSVTYTVEESKFINGLLNKCLPTGSNVDHSYVDEAVHLEFVVGHTQAETLSNYEHEAQWWLSKINTCTSREQYVHYVQQYHYLAEVYEEHHVHVHEQACPSWEYVSTHRQ